MTLLNNVVMGLFDALAEAVYTGLPLETASNDLAAVLSVVETLFLSICPKSNKSPLLASSLQAAKKAVQSYHSAAPELARSKKAGLTLPLGRLWRLLTVEYAPPDTKTIESQAGIAITAILEHLLQWLVTQSAQLLPEGERRLLPGMVQETIASDVLLRALTEALCNFHRRW
jgi:hypothetical protein